MSSTSKCLATRMQGKILEFPTNGKRRKKHVTCLCFRAVILTQFATWNMITGGWCQSLLYQGTRCQRHHFAIKQPFANRYYINIVILLMTKIKTSICFYVTGDSKPNLLAMYLSGSNCIDWWRKIWGFLKFFDFIVLSLQMLIFIGSEVCQGDL